MNSDECPRCGCNDFQVLRQVKVWGTDQEKRGCNHCGKTWTTRDTVEKENLATSILKIVIPFVRIRCPHCGSKATKVTSNRGKGLRFHECRTCRKDFHSLEEGG